MNKNTKQRIEFYKDHLPKMKEKLIAAATMLLVAAVMITSATFAWITLSTSPEVRSIDTTVTANGNLEIALSNPEGTVPGKSAAGDSTAAGTALTAANLTWGNVINLSDPAYGLSNIVLRPAALNGTSGLLSNPLYGVSYGTDGRVNYMTTEDDFAYVYYDTESKKFLSDIQSKHRGVRAISTVKYENLEGNQIVIDTNSDIKKRINAAKSNYAKMVNNDASPGKEYISSLEGLMTIYAQNVIDKKDLNTLDVTAYVEDLYEMFKYLHDNVIAESDKAYHGMARLSEFIDNGVTNYTVTMDELCNQAINNKLSAPVAASLTNIKQYALDRRQLKTYITDSATGDFKDLTVAQQKSSLAYYAYKARQGEKVTWGEISTMLNWMVSINSCEVEGYPMSQLMGHATEIFMNNGTKSAVFKQGALVRTEQYIGQKMSTNVTITVDASAMRLGKKTINANVTTVAEAPFLLDSDLTNTLSKYTGTIKGTTATAEDTYAMAVDFWLRTNAGSRDTEAKTTETSTDENGVKTTVERSNELSYVTLEGTVRTKTEEIQVMTKDLSGKEYPEYIAKYTLDGEDKSEKCFLRDGKHYIITNENMEVDVDELAKENNIDVTYSKSVEIKTTVIGYDGENRVWKDDQMAEYPIEGTSTTQGSGSCYVFYADKPADQARFLELLKAMKVVFVNSNGDQIGAAVMDTQNHFAQNGKVTVPLALDKNSSTYLGIDNTGKDIYGITELKRAVPEKITTIIYLDGTRLSNDMVLANGDIQGNLNIQFSSRNVTRVTTTVEDSDGTRVDVSYELAGDSIAIKDPELMDDAISASAAVDKNSFEFAADNKPKTNLTVTVDGTAPANVSARFIRAVNSTQGLLQDKISLTKSGDKWTAPVTFNTPCNYILRTVFVDGVEYDLQEPVEVTVTGIHIDYLTCDAITTGRQANIMTANSTYTTGIHFGFTSSAGMPTKLNGVFMDENDRPVYVPFKFDKGEWFGKVTFGSSGKYTLKYYEVDGETYEIKPEELQVTLDITLGIKTRVWVSCSAETLEKLQAADKRATANSFTVIDEAVTLDISVEIYDNTGKELKELNNTHLYYSRAGSTVKGLDSAVKWDAVADRYMGSFLVSEAGSYKFNRVEIGDNSITSFTNAPTIQAMPPADAYYYDNRTSSTYMFAPDGDAAFVLGIAYSSAASKVEATITNGNITSTVEGTSGIEVVDDKGVSITPWEFRIPDNGSGSQDGEWRVTKVTLYGVYYSGALYDENNGVDINLADEKISAKVVNVINVNIIGSDTEYTGYFMDDHKNNDLKITFTDGNGDKIDSLNIDNVKLTYYFDASQANSKPTDFSNEFGYTASGLETVNVSSSGTDNGSGNEFTFKNLNFQVAGNYRTCAVTFNANGTATTAGGKTSKINYIVNGSASDKCPLYTVKWNAPTVKITATNPTAGTKFTQNVDGRGSTNLTENTVANYISDDGFYANVYLKVSTMMGMATGYTLPQATFRLSNAGSKISSSNTAVFTIKNNQGSKYDNIITFTGNNTTQTSDIGGMEGNSRRALDKAITKTIVINYSGREYTVKLSNEVTVREPTSAYARFRFDIPSEYSDFITLSTDERVADDGRDIVVEFPKITHTEIVSKSVGDTTVTYRYTETTQPIKWTTTSSGCNGTTTTNHTGTKVTTTKEKIENGTVIDVERSYSVDKWNLTETKQTNDTSSSTSTVSSGTKKTFTINKNVASPIVTYTDSEQIGEAHIGQSITELPDATTVVWKEGNTTINQPDGWSKNGNETKRTWESNS